MQADAKGCLIDHSEVRRGTFGLVMGTGSLWSPRFSVCSVGGLGPDNEVHGIGFGCYWIVESGFLCGRGRSNHRSPLGNVRPISCIAAVVSHFGICLVDFSIQRLSRWLGFVREAVIYFFILF